MSKKSRLEVDLSLLGESPEATAYEGLIVSSGSSLS